MEEKLFHKRNYIGLLVGIGLLVIGFIALSRPPVDGFWTLNAAPIILCIAYCIVFPIAILLNGKKEKNEEN